MIYELNEANEKRITILHIKLVKGVKIIAHIFYFHKSQTCEIIS